MTTEVSMFVNMHMADGLVSLPVGLTFYFVMVLFVGYAMRKMQQGKSHQVAFMAVMGAFVFAAQMINFTIPGTGSSGHITGGLLLCLALGEFPALLAISCVLIIQCLLFGDGGLLALGCNVFNMGIIPCFIVYPLIVKPLLKKAGVSSSSLMKTCVLGCVVSAELGALCVCLETVISGITALPLVTFMGLMLPIHLAIGFVEGVITALVMSYVHRNEPAYLLSTLNEASGQLSTKIIRVAAIAAIITAGGLSLFASGYPDGLEWSIKGVTGDTEIAYEDRVRQTFADVQEKTSLFPDYAIAQTDALWSGSGAGLVGFGVTLVIIGGIGYVMTRSRQHE